MSKETNKLAWDTTSIEDIICGLQKGCACLGNKCVGGWGSVGSGALCSSAVAMELGPSSAGMFVKVTTLAIDVS